MVIAMNPGPLMVGIESFVLKAEEEEQLQHPLIGGVILFQRNIQSPQQTFELTEALHRLRKPALLVAVDQEGGPVCRLKDGYTNLPALGRIGALYDRDPKRGLEIAESHGWLMAKEVRAAGFDLSFAPVLDLDRGSEVIGKRAFHHDPQAVSALAKRYVDGMQRAGMAAVGKHFPGHGSVRADSHHELPVDARSLNEIMQFDLVPFMELIQHGLSGIMAAHVVYSQVDEHGAGFSRRWLEDMLRGRLNFRGAIFSDDLCMTAAHGVGDCTTRARQALQAGCDMVIVAEPNEVAAMLDRLEAQEDPTRQSRLLRLRGSGHTSLARLQNDLAWRKAARDLVELEEQT